MDKNFVKIDDLVRQRLEGGEERERSGAWLRMQDLLDKEMPRDRYIGMIYWRRMFGALAVLLLVVAATGGYQLSTLRNRVSAHDNALLASVATAPVATGPTVPTATKDNQMVISQASVADNNTLADNSNQKNEPAQPQNEKPVTKKIAAAGAIAKTSAHQKDDNSRLLAANTQLVANNVPAADKKTAVGHTEKAAVVAGNKTPVAAGNAMAATPTAEKVTRDVKDVATEKEVAANETGKAAPVKLHKKIIAAPAVGTIAKTAAGHDKTATAKVPTVNKADKAVNKTLAKKAAHKDDKTPAAITKQNMSATAKAKPADAIKTGRPAHDKDVAKLALGSGAPALNNTPAVADKAPAGNRKIADKTIAKKTTPEKGVAGTGKNPAADKQKPIAADGNHNTGKPDAGKTDAGVADRKAIAATKPAMKIVPPANLPPRQKRVVQKLILLERYVRISETEGYFHMDTISMESLTEDLSPEDARKPYLAAMAKKKVAGGSESAEDDAAANPNVLAASGATASAKPAMGNKGKSTGASSGGGAGVLQGLSQAFNDIKYKASGVKFAMGLTAGINGTFFSPSSFNGFQFGVTGCFMFGNAWSLGTAVQYFQRINGSYTLNDNYYNYTSLPTGGYMKQQESNTYSFSTLHSLEMPLYARYTNGNFSFLVGANLVYNFNVNVSEAATPPQGPAVYSYSQANDERPKVDVSTDFNARFGLGCLFGVSYQLNRKVSLDLRDVQTLWDNAPTSGSKYISNQLYKSPSLQFSIGYRLGGGKDKK